MSKPPISIVILTKNEECNIADCLQSVSGLDDIIVVDSGSTDDTLKLAREMGAQVHSHEFVSFATQRNWIIDNISTRHPWQFHLDADERMTPQLLQEIAEELASEPAAGGYFVANRLMLGNQWLRHSSGYPVYQVRLFHRDRLRFVDSGHGQREKTNHPLGKLKNDYLHYAFKKGLDDWFAKHAKYARQEAQQTLANQSNKNPTQALDSLSPDVAKRRRLKALVQDIPGRYLLRLLYMLTLQKACLDGPAGFVYANMMAIYEAMVEVNLEIIKHGIRL
jgi:glycosyltransferase involved in cell wall biosynthesis